MFKRILASVSAVITCAAILSAPADARTSNVPGLKSAGTCNDEFKAIRAR